MQSACGTWSGHLASKDDSRPVRPGVDRVYRSVDDPLYEHMGKDGKTWENMGKLNLGEFGAYSFLTAMTIRLTQS